MAAHATRARNPQRRSSSARGNYEQPLRGNYGLLRLHPCVVHTRSIPSAGARTASRPRSEKFTAPGRGRPLTGRSAGGAPAPPGTPQPTSAAGRQGQAPQEALQTTAAWYASPPPPRGSLRHRDWGGGRRRASSASRAISPRVGVPSSRRAGGELALLRAACSAYSGGALS
jgi:hypothetical protein